MHDSLELVNFLQLRTSWIIGIININYAFSCFIYYCIVSVFAGSCVYCDIQLLHNTELCLDQLVEYQCTVNRTESFYGLTWKILQDNGTQFGSPVSFTSNALGGPFTIGGLFTVEQLTLRPLVCNISFTVQSSINGYTIICEDAITLKNENISINVDGKSFILFTL